MSGGILLREGDFEAKPAGIVFAGLVEIRYLESDAGQSGDGQFLRSARSEEQKKGEKTCEVHGEDGIGGRYRGDCLERALMGQSDVSDYMYSIVWRMSQSAILS